VYHSYANGFVGSGCIAALEAEKFLAEQEDSVENKLEAEKEVKKGTTPTVPEYHSNPLL
jgi:thioredoxin reductase (NADPH)